jgi:hypothetical protein
MITNIGIDCDGIQFDFGELFSHIINELFHENYPIFKDEDSPSWEWGAWHPAGPERIAQAWEYVYTIPDFYEKEKLINPAELKYMIGKLNNHPKINVYFITSRKETSGRKILQQTIYQLKLIGWDNPQVIVSFAKGGIARILDLKYFIDDRAENCAEVALYNPSTKVYVMDRPYNRFLQEKYFKITRTDSLIEFTDAVLKAVEP